ncbi:FAD dependent oxidoreductase [Trematosphaeria pertusa]|uniref:FAD dependent oxidoreductase n=1 Tax=Trematosphaeria pertusa TaxID=390896 RepID=A0A6A6I331_9PLEO|nr:FAD dependent oxidoreductase [Trematosphaeria pertusa]KAF2243990.1 FAD dependent oxidoreductase [Trematosphaeria pertusa]
MATMSDPKQFMRTSGETDAVWVHKEPYSNRPQFTKLNQDLETDVCIIGSGIAGISTAYELVTRGLSVVMIEAREVLSGETGRTSGHLANDLDDGYTNIAKKHGDSGAKMAAESHTWALNRVGELSKQLGIECEYRHLPGYDISQYPRDQSEHTEDMKELITDGEKAKELGIATEYKEGFAIKGWEGKIDQRDAVIYPGQATFHPTKYLVGVLKWLKNQPNFSCYTYTRATDVQEKGVEVLGLGHKDVYVKMLDGNTIKCRDAVEATCVLLQKLSVIAEEEYYRTYCIAIRVPKGSVEDCLFYDSNEAYKYVRLTECDEKDDYLVVGGGDHKVGQGDTSAPLAELESWTRVRFPQAGSVDYKWSGQVFEPVDYMAFIGKNQGQKHTYIVTGDSGNGLTHGVLAGKLIADEITGNSNPWAKLYDPSRLLSIAKSAGSMITHDVQINTQYKRFTQSDIKDIEDLVPGEGGVLNPTASKPMAVYKDDGGQVHKFSALCPHMKGVVCWNNTEKSWDCPVHGSRFSKEGVQLCGPAKAGLSPADESGAEVQSRATKV